MADCSDKSLLVRNHLQSAGNSRFLCARKDPREQIIRLDRDESPKRDKAIIDLTIRCNPTPAGVSSRLLSKARLRREEALS